jgi:hypothetical protein
MGTVSWLARRFAWVTLIGMIGMSSACDQPAGLVVTVYGAKDASELWLTVGDEAVEARQPRFLRSGHESGVVPSRGPFSDGFEIYLERAALQKRPEVALVLDAVRTDSQVSIQRDTYLVTPKANALLEVRLTPRTLADGRWVCPGQARSGADSEGFATASEAADLDCDRDGWFAEADSDDADPLVARPLVLSEGPRLFSYRDGEPRCGVSFGGHQLRTSLSPGTCGACLLPTTLAEVESCLSSGPDEMVCTVRGTKATFSVKDLASSVKDADWELAKVWPPTRFSSGFFAPTNLGPEQWSVTFTGVPLTEPQAWFVLTDRSQGTSTLVKVEFGKGNGERDECKPK